MEEAIKPIIEFAKSSGVGYWELIAGVSVIVMAFRTPELLKVGSEFLNERKRINDATALKQRQAQRTLDAAKAKREKAGTKT